MPLLKLTTTGDKHAAVDLWCDGVAFDKPAYGQVWDVLAMSIIGPEQSVRALAAGCALAQPYLRVGLEFRAGGRSISGKWTWPWPRSMRSHLIAEGAMHLIAMGESRVPDPRDPKHREHVVIPSANTDEAMHAAIYDCLLLNYSTPLIPCDRTGQPAFEKLSGKVWRKWIVDAVMKDSLAWAPLLPHPEQPDRSWARAGVLKIRQKHLDEIVSRLVRTRRITIPEVV